MRMCAGLAAVAAISLSVVACSSPPPTAPSRVDGIVPDQGFSAPLASRPDASFCDRFSGEARGLCHAVIALNCGPGDNRGACTALTDRLGAATGRTYIGRSPEECAVIRFVCPAGTEPFSDPTGCGCQPVP